MGNTRNLKRWLQIFLYFLLFRLSKQNVVWKFCFHPPPPPSLAGSPSSQSESLEHTQDRSPVRHRTHTRHSLTPSHLEVNVWVSNQPNEDSFGPFPEKTQSDMGETVCVCNILKRNFSCLKTKTETVRCKFVGVCPRACQLACVTSV